jgi:hypothetical protein
VSKNLSKVGFGKDAKDQRSASNNVSKMRQGSFEAVHGNISFGFKFIKMIFGWSLFSDLIKCP